MLMNNYLTANASNADTPIVKLIDFGLASPIGGIMSFASCGHYDILAVMLMFDVCIPCLTHSFRK
jgi:energy-converting hydrogenase Eha subunit C